MAMDTNLIQAVCVALLGGEVLHASDLSAGKGSVIDWRTVKSGEILLEGADAYDTAVTFVSLAGWKAVAMALDGETEVV